jgi:hypothetical protein
VYLKKVYLVNGCVEETFVFPVLVGSIEELGVELISLGARVVTGLKIQV